MTSFRPSIISGLVEFWTKFRKNRGGVVGMAILIFMTSIALLAPVLAPGDPLAMVGKPFVPPNSAFPMGTDHIGRDVYKEVVHAAGITMLIGLLAAATAASVGIIMGAMAGYFGGPIDEVLMRVTEFFQVVPRLLLAIVVVATFGGSVWNIIVVIGLLSWPRTARILRGQFLTLKERPYVEAAKSIGASAPAIIFGEILPNAIPPVIVQTSLEVANAILVESMLSFLGLGDPSTITWGYMLNRAQEYLRANWWMATFPGLAISAVVLGLNLIGDGLNDALNPKLKEK
jgi:peptide/nickel transport system permease protein